MFNVYNRYTDTAGNLHFTDCYEKHGREHIIRADGGAGMSECVVRMEMPKCCDDCDANYDCCACGIIGAFWFRNPRYKEFDSSKERLPNCPIICQLPEGHGRLVDADALTRLMLERKQPLVGADSSKDRYRYMQWLSDFNAIKDAKVIVPAERSETEQL